VIAERNLQEHYKHKDSVWLHSCMEIQAIQLIVHVLGRHVVVPSSVLLPQSYPLHFDLADTFCTAANHHTF
jgi:hypothetical protein